MQELPSQRPLSCREVEDRLQPCSSLTVFLLFLVRCDAYLVFEAVLSFQILSFFYTLLLLYALGQKVPLSSDHKSEVFSIPLFLKQMNKCSGHFQHLLLD